MTKEELKELGLTDEQITKIVEDYGKNYVSKADFNDKNNEAKRLKAELTTELEKTQTLTSKNKEINESNTALTAQLEALKQDTEQQQAEHSKAIKSLRMEYAIESAISGQKAKDNKLVRALLKISDEDFEEDGTIKGLEDQLKGVATTHPYLFDSGEPTIKGAKPGEPNGDTSNGITKEQFLRMGYAERVQLKQDDPEQYALLVKGE